MVTGKLKFTLKELQDAFPRNEKIRQPRPIQEAAMAALADGRFLQELPPGTGKTALEYTVCCTALKKIQPEETIFWIVPTKALVEQIKQEHPSVQAVFGQNEHPCPWAKENFEHEPTQPVTRTQLPLLYEDSDVARVSDVPQFMHARCPHYVNQDNGQVNEVGMVPCPYYQQTYEAKQGGKIIVATMSFYIFAKLFSKRVKETVHDTSYGRVALLVIDEVHRLADVIRYTLSYDITDWHLERAIELLKTIDAPEHHQFRKFLKALKDIAKAHQKEPHKEHLLMEDEIRKLIAILEEIDPNVLDPDRIKEAISAGLINAQRDWQQIKTIETLARDIRKYIHNFELGLAKEDAEGNVVRRPLNYSCSFYKTEKGENERVQHKIVLHCHYVVPLVKKRLKPPTTISFSGTIGRADLFGYDSGITEPLFSAPSTFPIQNRRIYLPSNVSDLSRRSDPTGKKKTKTLRQIAKACLQLINDNIRSLVIVTSNDERATFMDLAEKEGLDAITYDDDVGAKDIAMSFKQGAGETLCGCTAHYGVGVDFPQGSAGAVFLLRPGYPNPNSAASQFEKARFGEGAYWSRTMYKVMLEVQQVPGRNIRGPNDKGVCFLMSSGFEKFGYHSLPEWLQPAYRRGMMLDDCLEDARALLVAT
jgi:Rad3-related DNA helicase